MDTTKPKLEWDEKYSVHVKEIDDQHKQLFNTINELAYMVCTSTTIEKVQSLVTELVEYKKIHFATEEKYFKEFGYDRAEAHAAEHKTFDEKVAAISKNNANDHIALAFALIDFLEDWLVEHLMNSDQLYVECFKTHGLK